MLDPSELLEAAGNSLIAVDGRPPSDAKVRRAVSTAYYALFHWLLREGAQRFAGARGSSSPAYGLFYRGYSHAHMKRVCEDVDKDKLPKKYERLGYGNFPLHIRFCARTFVELQQKRHQADYDPQAETALTDALSAIADAEFAMTLLADDEPEEREDFLALLLVGARD